MSTTMKDVFNLEEMLVSREDHAYDADESSPATTDSSLRLDSKKDVAATNKTRSTAKRSRERNQENTPPLKKKAKSRTTTMSPSNNKSHYKTPRVNRANTFNNDANKTARTQSPPPSGGATRGGTPGGAPRPSPPLLGIVTLPQQVTHLLQALCQEQDTFGHEIQRVWNQWRQEQYATVQQYLHGTSSWLLSCLPTGLLHVQQTLQTEALHMGTQLFASVAQMEARWNESWQPFQAEFVRGYNSLYCDVCMWKEDSTCPFLTTTVRQYLYNKLLQHHDSFVVHWRNRRVALHHDCVGQWRGASAYHTNQVQGFLNKWSGTVRYYQQQEQQQQQQW